MPTTHAHPALERFLALVEDARERETLAGEAFTDTGAPAALGALREAVPVARAILAFGHVLDSSARPLEAFIREKHAAIDQTPAPEWDPDHDSEKAAAADTATYSVALALGLLLADTI